MFFKPIIVIGTLLAAATLAYSADAPTPPTPSIWVNGKCEHPITMEKVAELEANGFFVDFAIKISDTNEIQGLFNKKKNIGALIEVHIVNHAVDSVCAIYTGGIDEHGLELVAKQREEHKDDKFEGTVAPSTPPSTTTPTPENKAPAAPSKEENEGDSGL